MAWVTIDDQFSDHPKVRKVGPICVAIQISFLCFSNRFLTDGFIEKSVAKSIVLGLSKKKGLLESMVEVGLLEVVEGGYQIHDYLDYNRSKAEILEKREHSKTAAKLGAKATNEKRWGSPKPSPSGRQVSDTSGDTGNIAPQPYPKPNIQTSEAIEGEPPSPPSFKPSSSEPPKTNGQFQPPEEIKLLANDLLRVAGIGDRQDKRDIAWDVYHACKADNEQIVHTLIAEIKAGEHEQANNIVAVIRARLRQ